LVKYEAQVSPQFFGLKNWPLKRREVERRRVERAMGSVEVEYFSFGMFDNETKTV